MIVNYELLKDKELYGYIAATITTIAFIPQAIKTWKSKSANDVSYIMLITFIIGLIFWIVYGIKTRTLPVLYANIITLIINLMIIILKISYDTRKE